MLIKASPEMLPILEGRLHAGGSLGVYLVVYLAYKNVRCSDQPRRDSETKALNHSKELHLKPKP